MPDLFDEVAAAAPRLFGLIGFPLGHSFSAGYFARKFREEGITDSSYNLFPIEDISELPGLLQLYPNLRGLNVTIPYKQQVLPYLDDISFLPLPAANCLKFTGGKSIGYNTDVAGFEISFREKLLPQHDAALVLGTGGASLAVQFVLGKLGIPFVVVSRNPGNGLVYDRLNAQIMAVHPVIINCTPLGTYPKVDACPPIPYQFLTAGHYCYDLVYNPEKTAFLQKAENQGAIIKNGADMLRIQAEESWKIWNI